MFYFSAEGRSSDVNEKPVINKKKKEKHDFIPPLRAVKIFRTIVDVPPFDPNINQTEVTQKGLIWITEG